jgi:hypothetical protein
MVDSCDGRLSRPHADDATPTAAHLEVEELALDKAQHEAGLARAHVSQKHLRAPPGTDPTSANARASQQVSQDAGRKVTQAAADWDAAMRTSRRATQHRKGGLCLGLPRGGHSRHGHADAGVEPHQFRLDSWGRWRRDRHRRGTRLD